MKKILLLMLGLWSVLALQVTVSAQGTILPKADRGAGADCDQLLNYFSEEGKFLVPNVDRDPTLGCAITTGRVSLPMVPYFIQYFSNYALGLVSILALLFVVIGGLLYTLGGLTEQKDKGKNYIKNALTGMIIAFMAWTIVNVIISAVTG